MKHTLTIFVVLSLALTASTAEIHVRSEVTICTLAKAQREVRKIQATVVVHGGTYYLLEKRVFTREGSATEYRSAEDNKIAISGLVRRLPAGNRGTRARGGFLVTAEFESERRFVRATIARDRGG